MKISYLSASFSRNCATPPARAPTSPLKLLMLSSIFIENENGIYPALKSN
jgi:hypothetical protein